MSDSCFILVLLYVAAQEILIKVELENCYISMFERVRGKMKKICFVGAVVLFCILSLYFWGNDRGRTGESYTSPDGTNTVIVEYDWVSRPKIYKKTWYGKTKIWQYEGSGFMESVGFSVDWVTEEKIRVYYEPYEAGQETEEYFVEIP